MLHSLYYNYKKRWVNENHTNTQKREVFVFFFQFHFWVNDPTAQLLLSG